MPDRQVVATSSRLSAITVVSCVCAVVPCHGGDTPAIIHPLNASLDRGNTAGAGYISGPTSPIHRFYNSDLEVALWNQPSALTLSLAKNDVWDRRYFGDRRRVINIDDVRRVCSADQIKGEQRNLGIANTAQDLYFAYDFPCPKPVGQLILQSPDLAGHDQYTAGRSLQEQVVTEGAKRKAKGTTWTFLHRTRNLLVLRGEYSGLSQPLQIQLYRHRDTTPYGTSTPAETQNRSTGYDYEQDAPDNGPLPHPEAGTDGRFFWIRQRFHPEKTFPGGFEYVMMALVEGVDHEVQAESDARNAGEKATVHPLDPEVEKRLPGYLKQKRLTITRVNNAESGALASATLRGSDPSFSLLVAVVTTRDATDPLAAGKQMLLDAQAEGADALLRESSTASGEQVRDWRSSRVMHYNATSCTYADFTPWHGDYHFNEGYFLPAIVQGEVDTLEQRLRLFEEMLPALRRNAREVYKCGGIAFPLVHYPITHDRVVYAHVTWEWGLENTALMLQPFWHTFQYTQDREFLRERAYPMMREGAEFYTDYVTKGDDGFYHVIPTVSQEHWGFTPGFKLNRDSVGALSFIKYHLKACLEASELLGVDADLRPKWRDIVENLAPYPTLEMDDGPVFCDVRDAPRLLNYNITANMVMTLWAEDISLDSPPESLDIARRTYQAIPDKEHSMRQGYLRQIRLYLGMPDKPDLSPQGRVLSWPGRIHLYAGVPEGAEVSDRFSGHLAVGGFEVSAMHVGTEVRRVRLKSRVGAECKVRSPWHPGDVTVLDLEPRQVVPHTMDADTIRFGTKAGHAYAVLSPAESHFAEGRFVADAKTIGRWRLDSMSEGVVPDESGNAHHAKLIGGAKLVANDGGQALQLDGNNSYAQIERTPAFDFAANESFSVKARFRVEPEGFDPMIPLVCSMALKQYCLTLSNGRVRFYLSSPKGDVYSFVDGKRVLVDGEWHTVEAVRDAATGTLRLHADGKLEGESGDLTTGDFACEAPVTIGAYLWGDRSRYANGLIDEVEIKSLGKLVKE